MQTDVRTIMLKSDLCVLCTCKNDIPDASLMLYICDDRCTKMYMLTLKETLKYENIVSNPHVSLLVDTRDNQPAGAAYTQALTIRGEAAILKDKDAAARIVTRMAKRHDRLVNFAANEDVRVIEVSIKGILFLEDADKVRRVDVDA